MHRGHPDNACKQRKRPSLNDPVCGVVERLAQSGYLALVPDLYRGQYTLEQEEAHPVDNDLAGN